MLGRREITGGRQRSIAAVVIRVWFAAARRVHGLEEDDRERKKRA